MCGIAGFSGRFPPEALERANARQSHRGPDGRGVYHDPKQSVGLAHVRLSILDPTPAGHQPMSTPSGTVHLVYNGEIYNSPALRRELQASGVAFQGTSDTEVLLRLLEAEGLDALPRLEGIFAFAAWDTRSRKLLLARDAFGVKPLYFASTADGVCFASELKALLELAPGLRSLDPVSIHRYLTFLWCPGGGTPLREVRKLAPGTAMVIEEGAVSSVVDWHSPYRPRTRLPSSDPEVVAGEVRDSLRTAVHDQLLSDVPVGAFLSGGLDSTAITSFARERIADLRCFTIDVKGMKEEGAPEDLPFARQAARHLDVKLEVIDVEAETLAGSFPAMIEQLDEPLADPAALHVRFISSLAREAGIKVLLSGAGGDDLFTGYRRHTAVRLDQLAALVPRPVLSAVDGVAGRFDQSIPLVRRIRRALQNRDFRGDRRIAGYLEWHEEAALRPLYQSAFGAGVPEDSAAGPMVELLAGAPASLGALERLLLLEQRFFLADHNLNYTDKMSMQCGVEVRVPFLDRRVADLAARIPIGLRQRGATGKWILKKAMEPILPHDLIYRPKTGFGAPLRSWMRGELKPVLDDVLSEDSLRARGLFDPAGVQRLRASNQAGATDGAYLLFALMSIELWCRSYLDR